MSNSTVKEIVKMVYDIYEMNFDISNYDFYDKLRDLTYSIWEEHHNELLNELELLDTESQIDFQLLWYDSLGFPQEIPKTYLKNGKPSYVFYGSIPSHICESVKDIDGFHDLNINYATLEDGYLTLYLDSRYCRVKSMDEYQVKIIFEKAEIICSDKNLDTIDISKLIGNEILSLDEIPMIPYIFNNVNLDISLLSYSKRLFYVSVAGDIGGDWYRNFYLICDKWDYAKNI